MKKANKLISILLVLAMLLSMAPLSLTAFAATPTPYDGVPVTPQKISSSNYAKLGLTDSNWSQFDGYYAIRNAKELYGFANIVNNQFSTAGFNGVLLQDIVVNANGGTTYDWTPLNDRTNSNYYEGIFDGNGHYISGLYSTTALTSAGSTDKFCGFTFILKGTVKNLTIKNSTFAPGMDIGAYGGIGVITAYPVGCTIENCRVENVTVKAISSNGQLGGIAGYGGGQNSTIKNCVSINVTFSGGGTTNAISNYAPYTNCYTSSGATHTCANISVEHKEVKATCEYPGLSNYKYCLVCGNVTSGTKTETPATGHTWKPATCQAPKTCSACGLTEGSVESHKYTTYTLSTNAMCGSNAKETAFCDYGCGGTDTREISGTALAHSYTYSASGNTITAVCANGVNCPDPEGTLTISAPADLYADGTTAKEATVENNLVDTSVAVNVTYSTVDGSAPKTAGTYTASVTVGGATASVEFTLLNYVAKVTDKDGNLVGNYKTYEDALTAAKENNDSTLTLLDDITITTFQLIDSGKFTLDLNGKTLLNETMWVLRIQSEGNLTIKDSGEGGTVQTTDPGSSAILNYGTLTVDSGIIKGDSGIDTSGTLTINGGTLETVDYNGISNYGTTYVYGGILKNENVDVISNSGTLYIYGGKMSGGSRCISNNGNTYISGGEFKADSFAALNQIKGTLEVTGGSFSGTDREDGVFTGKPCGEFTVCCSDAETIIFKGGEFPDGFAVYGTTANTLLADGYHFRDADGKVINMADDAKIINGYVKVTKGADLSEAVVTIDDSALTYTGEEIIPTVAVKVSGKTLTEGKDYTLTFANNINAGTATVTVKAVSQAAGGIVGGANSNAGNSVESIYTGEITKEFTILKADSAVETQPTANELTYNGTAQKLITAGSAVNSTMVYSLDGAEYSEEIPTGTYAGTYYVYYKVIGDANHNDSEPETVTVTIGKKPVTVSATVPDRIYGDDYRVDTSKVVVTFDGIIDGDDVGYAVIDAYYQVHTVTDNAPVQVVYNANGTDAGNYQFPEYGDWLAPNYPVQTTGKVLPRDIADAEITLGDTLTYNSAEQTQSIASVTIIGKDVTYTVSGNTATNVGIYELTITGNGNFTGTKTATFEIAPDTSAIDNLTDDNVKSSDKTAIEAVAKQIENAVTDLADDAKKAEYKEIADKCDELLAKIDATADEIAGIDEAVNGYDKETVTSDDVPTLGELIDEIEVLTDGDNLTEEQKTELEELKAELEALLKEIEKAGSAVDAIGAELEMLDEKRATIFHEDEIEALKAKIDELLTDENMGKEEKAKLNEYKAQCDNLIEIINTPVKYFSMRLLYLIYDAFNWLASHIMLIFSLNF